MRSGHIFRIERAVEQENHNTADPLLGHWHGWMAIIAAIASVEMVFDGQRHTIVQRNRTRLTYLRCFN